MNWTKVVIAGGVAGVAAWLLDFVGHVVILGKTSTEYSVFSQEPIDPIMFLLVMFCITLTAAVIYAKTKDCWEAGAKGGITFGFLLGLFGSFPFFYNSMIYVDFPYFLSWCWTGINVIEMIVAGVIIALIYK